MVGYRTYLNLAVVLVHQLFKAAGYDVPSENVSIAIDTIFGGLAAVYAVAKQKRLDSCVKP